jgi:uncharacterized damage-inducible protein DinB
MSVPKPLNLEPPAGYASAGAASVALLASQLDEPMRVLLASLAGKDAGVLEWQLRPGTNSIGMLLAHLAIVEAYWIQAIATGQLADADRVVRATTGLGMMDDGLPIARDGGHPESLRGWTVADYAARLDRARAATHSVLRAWTDDDLERAVEHEGRLVSRAWIVFHVGDHFAHHAGQIALLRSLHELGESAAR